MCIYISDQSSENMNPTLGGPIDFSRISTNFISTKIEGNKGNGQKRKKKKKRKKTIKGKDYEVHVLKSLQGPSPPRTEEESISKATLATSHLVFYS